MGEILIQSRSGAAEEEQSGGGEQLTLTVIGPLAEVGWLLDDGLISAI